MTIEQLKNEKELVEVAIKAILQGFTERTGVESITLTGRMKRYYASTGKEERILLSTSSYAELKIEI